MPEIKNIIITADILNKISTIDSFKALWKNEYTTFSAIALNKMKRIATIESIGSSNRIEGNVLQDSEIEAFFNQINKKSFRSRDEEEIAGYADLINLIFENYNEIPLSENYIKQLHQILLNYSQKDSMHRGAYKTHSNKVAAYKNGKEIGTIFETASPFETPLLMQELIQWTNATFQDHFLHPIITIGIFIVHFLAIHPFTDGNGRLSRALTILLLLKNGYSYMPYASMESVIEANKNAYYRSLRATQKTFFTKKIDYLPWLTFFIGSLEKQIHSLKNKLQTTNINKLTPMQESILNLFDNGRILTVPQIVDSLNKNPETIRKAVYTLKAQGFLIKKGSTKGTGYQKK